MATPTVLQFMQKTAEDQRLQQQLGTLLGVGDGDISSQAELDVPEAEALKGDRAPTVVDFAARLGFVFSVPSKRYTNAVILLANSQVPHIWAGQAQDLPLLFLMGKFLPQL